MKTRIIAISLLLISSSIDAREIIGKNGGKVASNANGSNSKVAASCKPGAGRTDLDINNVRTTIFTSGDMWWDLNSNPRYEIPKIATGSSETRKHSSFAGSLWIGGVDDGGSLKVAAMTYRQSGNDFWPGPLKIADASVTADVCLAYDQHWKITRKEVEDFVIGGLAPTEVIQSWPGNGIVNGGDEFTGFASQLAPYVDVDDDGIYNPDNGDYPGYDVTGDLGCDAKLFGDQTIWWVFNDKGNVHSEFGGFPLGVEIRAQAFAFATNNSLNNMTFYNYEIINRSDIAVNETYVGVWTDSDIGNYIDDYVGCDVGRGLGIAFNGDADDETNNGYGLNPPAFGIDFFEGPFMDADSTDNSNDPCLEPKAYNGLGFGDTIVDNERIGMSKFVYYNNTSDLRGNPDNYLHIYNYLRGRWKDGTPMVYGGDGYGSGQATNFMFPGNTDPLGIGQIANGNTTCLPQAPWSEETVGNEPGDRRFVQSAGPITLEAGAVNTVTIGAVWARASSGGQLASVELVKVADDDAQALFDNCFGILNGPDAPVVNAVELDKEVILNLVSTGNDKVVQYSEVTTVPGYGDVTYNFQGYLIYQLKSPNVTVSDRKDPNLARLIFQCDLRDTVDQLINKTFDLNLNAEIPVEEVNGENKGIRNSFRVTTDAFATGNNKLVNHKQYYFMVLSYAVSQGTPADFDEPFFAGRRTYGASAVQVYTTIPHINSPEQSGMSVQSAYGDKPIVTRIEGYGNGGNNIDLSDETINKILAPPYWAKEIVYQKNKAPINVKVIDPLKIPLGDFEFKFEGLADTSKWVLKYGDAVYRSIYGLANPIEQVISDFGFSVTVGQVPLPGDNPTEGNGFVTASSTFQDNTKRWITFLADAEGSEEPRNWIRAGVATFPATVLPAGTWNDYPGIDDVSAYEKVLGGTWAPYPLVSRFADGPSYTTSANIQTLGNLRKIPGIDVVFTADQSKWSRCPVFETTDDNDYSVGGANKLTLRASPSVGKNGQPDGDGLGMGWFPGYAINVETGERLNIAFGESSRLTQDNGRDMLFNPSSRTVAFDNGQLQAYLGGKHFIYVFNHVGDDVDEMPRYDEGAFIRNRFATAPAATAQRNIFQACAWVSIPLGVANQPFLTNDLNVKIRVQRPYVKNYNAVDSADGSAAVNNNFPIYTFNTAGVAPIRESNELAKNALDLINVVPNPYYAFSAYETGQLDNRVKITNLPKVCKINIYTTGGILVRTFSKDSEKTSLDWDLKNQSNITISSGVYIIHVQADGIGEKVVKWFGVMRPIDLDSF